MPVDPIEAMWNPAEIEELQNRQKDLDIKDNIRMTWLEKLNQYTCKDDFEKSILIFNCMYWSAIKHTTIPLPKNTNLEELEKIWKIAKEMAKIHQLGWLRESSFYRIGFKESTNNLTWIDISIRKEKNEDKRTRVYLCQNEPTRKVPVGFG